jgi:hypothetical protein
MILGPDPHHSIFCCIELPLLLPLQPQFSFELIERHCFMLSRIFSLGTRAEIIIFIITSSNFMFYQF